MDTFPQPKAKSRPTSVRYLVLLLLCLAALIAYAGRNCLGVASEAVERDLGIDAVGMGAVMSAFFWSYALLQVPAGWLGHRWGARGALCLYAVCWSLACLLIGRSWDLPTLLGAQIVFGAAQAGVFPCSAAAISQWLPATRRALATGSLASFMSIGGALGSALTGRLLDGLGWRGIFVLVALPGFAWAACFHLFFRDRPEEHDGVNSDELRLIRAAQDKPLAAKPEPSTTGPRWSRLITEVDLWLICAQQFFRAAGYVFYATWFPTYLRETYAVTTAMSGYLTTLPLAAVVAGGFSGGWLIDSILIVTGSRRLSRQGVAILSLFACGGLIFLAYLADNVAVAVLLITAGSFCAALAGPCSYTVTIEKADRFVAPVFGIMNMVGNLGAAVCPLVVGLYVKASGGAWQWVLLLFAANYAAAAICWTVLNPNGTFAHGPSALDDPSR